MNYQEMKSALEHQRIHGVDLSEYVNEDGRVEALVCECGLYRRDKPPGVYVCGCGRNLIYGHKRLMCHGCSEKIINGRSSYASFVACRDCQYRASADSIVSSVTPAA